MVKHSQILKKQVKSPHRKLFTFLVYLLICELLIIGTAYGVIKELSVGLPGLEELEQITDVQSLSTIVYSSDDVELRTFQREKRFWVKYYDIPQCMFNAITSAEDSRFFNHWGISLPDILRALWVDIRHQRIKQGASTITQQLARDLFLDRKTTIRRKLKEMIVAIKIEQTYSKSEIMEMYLNRMFFGNNSYGIQAASRGYFGKNASELTVSESALLSGVLQSPTTYNPRSKDRPPLEQLKLSQYRRNIVLMMMMNDGKINRADAAEEMKKPVELASLSGLNYGKAPNFVDYIRGILDDTYGEEFVETQGAKVYTTLNYESQKIAEQALQKQLDLIQESYANDILYTRPSGISNYEAYQDSLNKTVVQGALVALDVETGKIIAMVGGNEYSVDNQFNRATQAKRQAGSSFKPFVYTAALDNGWRCCDTIYDGPVSYENYDGTFWEPRNFEGEYLGIMSLRDGYKNSQNIISVKLVNDMENHGIGAGIVKKYAHRMGITTYIPEVRSIAVGSPEVKLIEMVSAYTIFPKLGIKTETIAIKDIYDKNNKLIYRTNKGNEGVALNPEVASLMLTMFKSVTTEGTASVGIQNEDMSDRPCGGKTGTAQEYKDAWFIGFTPYIACGVWIGFDSEESTLQYPIRTGATAALPVWVNFIKEASELLGYPKYDFKLAGNNITTDRICKDSYLRAGPLCPADRVYTEYFIKGSELNDFCDVHDSRKREQDDLRFRSNQQKKRLGL